MYDTQVLALLEAYYGKVTSKSPLCKAELDVLSWNCPKIYLKFLDVFCTVLSLLSRLIKKMQKNEDNSSEEKQKRNMTFEDWM